MTVVVGVTDAFERRYIEKFRVIISDFGEIVKYEYDRGARDIGLHLTQKLTSGKERLSSSFCWFQLKGFMKDTLSEEEFGNKQHVSLSLEVNHLKYWYLQPIPTHLVVYVESVDTFLIMNVSKYVAEKWGKDILTLNQKTATVHVPKLSILDEHVFRIILAQGNIQEWKKALGSDEKSTSICHRDYDLIWHLGTAKNRAVEHQIYFMEWQSKARSQFYIQEKALDGTDGWHTLREHWQSMMTIGDLEESYPYIEFSAEGVDDDWCDDEDDNPTHVLSNGEIIYGYDCSREYFKYVMSVRLNKLGNKLFKWVNELEKIGLIEITPGKSEIISVAPWNRRDV